MKSATYFCYALGDETRWRIALLILDQALCVCELEEGLILAQSTLSSHLKIMRGAGMVEVDRKQKWAYYQLTPAAATLVRAIGNEFPAEKALIRKYQADRARIAKRIALRGTDCSSSGRRRAIPPELKEAGKPSEK